jgi:perosamine synthetase
MKLPLSKPDITAKEVGSIYEVLKTDCLSIGPKLEQFEAKFTDYFQIKHAIGVNSGTSGLHLLIKAMNIGEGDEVITTPFSFVASANCILYERAVPVFVDIDEKTLNIDLNRVEQKITDKTKAILAVDVFGHPVDMEKIEQIAGKYNLKVIEDACEALGSEHEGIKAGTLCDGSVFAFYPNKQITTGEGGMIITDDDEIASLCRSMRSQGRAETGTWLYHERLGFNFRMSELNAALGVAQMERLMEILDKREKVAQIYNEKLKGVEGIKTPYICAGVTRMSWFVYVIRLDPKLDRDVVLNHLIENGIGCKPYFTPIHLQPYMREFFGFSEGDYPITEMVSRSTIALPFYNNLKQDEIQYVVENLKDIIYSL